MRPATATLVFPVDGDLRQLSGKRVPLEFTKKHPSYTEGNPPLLVDVDGEWLTDAQFRRLRVKLGAWIETNNRACVCDALGVQQDEPGIIMVGRTDSSAGALPA